MAPPSEEEEVKEEAPPVVEIDSDIELHFLPGVVEEETPNPLKLPEADKIVDSRNMALTSEMKRSNSQYIEQNCIQNEPDKASSVLKLSLSIQQEDEQEKISSPR